MAYDASTLGGDGAHCGVLRPSFIYGFRALMSFRSFAITPGRFLKMA